MDGDSTRAFLERELGRIAGDIQKFGDKMKEKQTDLDTKQTELQARLLAVEQARARPRGDPGDGGGSNHGAALSKAADDIVAGMKDATSTRITVPMSIKATSLSSATYIAPPESLGPVSTYHPATTRLLDLLPSRPVTSNTIIYVRVHYDEGNSPPDGNMAAKVAQLALKPQSSVATDLVSVTLSTYAHWLDSSKQILDDVTELQAILDSILRGGLLDIVDASVYTTLTTSGNFTTFTPVATEVIGDSVARIAAQIVNLGGQNVQVALNPTDYLSMQLRKASGSGEYLGLPSNLAARVVSAPAVASGKILAFAPITGAGWADREGVNVQVGLKNDDFTKNKITLLCETRGDTLVRDAQHVAYGNVTA